MKIQTMKYLITILTLFFFTATLAQATLEYTLEKGDVFVVQQNAEQTIIQEMDGAIHELTNNMNGVLEFKVIDENEDTYAIDLTFKDLNLLMVSNIQGELLNVKANEIIEGDVQSQIFNSLLNTPVHLILTKTGDILEVNGGDSLVIKMANASGIEDEFSRNLLKKGLEKEFGSKALSESYKQLTFIYSDRFVDTGDTWQNEYSGKLNAKNTWTLTSLTKDKATINGKADVELSSIDSGTKMNLSGVQTTEIQTDVTTGFILEMIVAGETQGTSTIAQLGEQQIPTRISSKITYKLIN